MPDLSQRANLSELMDDPHCDEVRLLRTVRQFSSINRLVSRYRTILKNEVLASMKPNREYHLVDMGAGGCDIDVWLLKAARQRGLKLRITACDIDPHIIAHARSTFGGFQGLEIRELDLLKADFGEPVDFVFANHFLHHLTNDEIVRLIQLWQPRVRERMVFSDLQRSQTAYWGYAALSLFYPNSFARTDGLISIRRGFQPLELSELAKQAIGTRPAVATLPPGRIVLAVKGLADL